MVDYASLGNRIRYRRKLKKLSQKEVADGINISVSFYGNIERGLRIPSIDTLVDIANFLDTSTDYLLAESVVVAGKQHSPEELRILCRYLRDRIQELDYGDEAEGDLPLKEDN